MDKFGGMFRCSTGEVDWEKVIGACLWSLVLVLALISLGGCGSTIKTAEYNFNQGTPAADTQAAQARGLTGPATVGGGCGNTIVIVEDTKQDSEADGALSTQGSTAATGAIRDAVSKLVTDMRQTDSNNPTTTTNTTNTTNPADDDVQIIDNMDDIEEDLAEPGDVEIQ